VAEYNRLACLHGDIQCDKSVLPITQHRYLMHLIAFNTFLVQVISAHHARLHQAATGQRVTSDA
jgi:hypothetical protein